MNEWMILVILNYPQHSLKFSVKENNNQKSKWSVQSAILG